MPNQTKLRQLARVAVRVGVNVQPNQLVVVRAPIESQSLVHLIAEEAYLAKAKKVMVIWGDESLARLGYLHMDEATLKEVPNYLVEQYRYTIEEDACFISVSSPQPGLLQDVDSQKVRASNIASAQALGFFREHNMSNKGRWTIVAAANPYWAKKVFPDLNEEEAMESLWELIFEASRISENEDVVASWTRHNNNLSFYQNWLNEKRFKMLKFNNKYGSNFTLELVNDHVWVGGGEKSTKGVYFNPNIPTEENFTMPYKYGLNGKVVATKPLNYLSKIIDGFWFEFEKGKVINYGAEVGLDALENLLNTDEGSKYTGEIAIVPFDSPISKMNRILFNTLFDENASCHIALGQAYPMNIKDGTTQDKETLIKRGYNDSFSHVDFMFGSEDLSIIGIQEDGTEVVVFKDGNYAF